MNYDTDFIILAEQSHMTKEISEIKINLIKEATKHNFKIILFELSPINFWIIMNKILTGDKNNLMKFFPDIWRTKSIEKIFDIPDVYISSYDIVQTFNDVNFDELSKECFKYHNEVFDFEFLKKIANKKFTDDLTVEKWVQDQDILYENLDNLRNYFEKIVTSKKFKKSEFNKLHKYILLSIPTFLKIDYLSWSKRLSVMNETEKIYWTFYMKQRDMLGSRYLIRLKKFKLKIIIWNHLFHAYYNYPKENKQINEYKPVNIEYTKNLKPVGYWLKKYNQKVYVLAILHGAGQILEYDEDKKIYFSVDYSQNIFDKQDFIHPPDEFMNIGTVLFYPLKDFDMIYYIPKISVPELIEQ